MDMAAALRTGTGQATQMPVGLPQEHQAEVACQSPSVSPG